MGGDHGGRCWAAGLAVAFSVLMVLPLIGGVFLSLQHGVWGNQEEIFVGDFCKIRSLASMRCLSLYVDIYAYLDMSIYIYALHCKIDISYLTLPS